MAAEIAVAFIISVPVVTAHNYGLKQKWINNGNGEILSYNPAKWSFVRRWMGRKPPSGPVDFLPEAQWHIYPDEEPVEWHPSHWHASRFVSHATYDPDGPKRFVSYAVPPPPENPVVVAARVGGVAAVAMVLTPVLAVASLTPMVKALVPNNLAAEDQIKELLLGVDMLPRKGKPGCEGDRHAFYV